MIFDFISSLRIFGSIIIGALLILLNMPVFIVIITHKRLRRTYAVLASVILLNGLTGFASLATGIQRVIIVANNDAYLMITNKQCIESLTYFIRFSLNGLNGIGLLAVSIDRLIVGAFPLYYFRHQLRLISMIMIIPYTSGVIFMIGALVTTIILPAHPVNILCGLQAILHPIAFTACLFLRAISAMSSTLVMTAVVIIMKKRIEYVKRNHKTVAHGNISCFVTNQARFTVTMILSSIFTIVLFVAPTCYQLAMQLFTFGGDELSEVLALYLSYINAFNMVCVVVLRQDDIKVCLMNRFIGKHTSELATERMVVTVLDGSRKEHSVPLNRSHRTRLSALVTT